jgi:arylsulfatase A-like enzyme
MRSNGLHARLRRHVWWLKELAPAVEHYKFLLRSIGFQAARSKRPNAILLSVDSMACKHLSCYGYRRSTSPNMDRIARSGVLFEHVIAQSNWTKPALASILTSLNPSVHKTDAQGETGDQIDVEIRKRAHVLDDRFRTMAEEFRQAGYATAAFSNGGYAHSFFGFGRGFDVYDNQAGGLKSCTYRLLQWICQNRVAPFMAWIHAWDAHFPYMDRPPYNRKFAKRRSRIVLDASIRHQINSGERILSAKELEFLRGLYDGAISYVDELIGVLVRELERLNLAESTFLVITADHGEAFMEHGYVEHTSCLHSEVLRVPLILLGPKLQRGQRIRSQVRSIDIMPTLLDLCGLTPGAEIQGVSLLPWITGNVSTHLLAASETERGGGQIALTDGRYKVIRRNTDNRMQIYDLVRDPEEKNDIAATCPKVRVAMESQLARWQSEATACADRYWSEDVAGKIREMKGEVMERLRNLGYVE